MLFLSVRGFLDYAGPDNPLAISVVAVLPSSYSEWSRHPDLRAFRSSIAPPTDASIYASRNTSRCSRQDSRSGWIRYFPSCRALASPTTCRFIPALSGWPTTRELLMVVRPENSQRGHFYEQPLSRQVSYGPSPPQERSSVAARWPLAMAPCTVPLCPLQSVASPAKNRVFPTGAASLRAASLPPARA